MTKRILPHPIVYDFALQTWYNVRPKEEWVYHGDYAVSETKKNIACIHQGSEIEKVNIFEFDQMYGVGQCAKCFKMHWYELKL